MLPSLRPAAHRPLAMSAHQPQFAPSGEVSNTPVARQPAAKAPLCFVVDSDPSMRHFLSLIMHGAGVDTEEFPDPQSMIAGLSRRNPEAVFLDIALDFTEVVGCVVALGQRGYAGYVQLMSSRGSAVLAHVKETGDQQRLLMLPPLKKPFDTTTIAKLLQHLKFGEPPAAAGRVDLDEALNSNWIELWYQPKIDLRKKQLAGAEAFARARHPVQGVLTPEAFIPGAKESSLIALAERTLADSLRAGLGFTKLGLTIPMAVNLPVSALVKIPLADIVQQYRSQYEKWPGLIIDVTEEQIISNLKLAHEISKQLAPLNVKLAIDNFGRGYSALTRQRELPFAELKLDRKFVADCGTDKVNAPLCKTVIAFAHHFSSKAVAIGVEKAVDAVALVSMGCDYGQGFLLGQPMPKERFVSLLRQRAAAQKETAPAAATAIASPP
jgi:EAL domain-containing protein (putative c-di-GMP-specific phosphodiesterase class I)/CheY-like chemotaxis protein